jgi:hypothetical protein
MVSFQIAVHLFVLRCCNRQVTQGVQYFAFVDGSLGRLYFDMGAALRPMSENSTKTGERLLGYRHIFSRREHAHSALLLSSDLTTYLTTYGAQTGDNERKPAKTQNLRHPPSDKALR